MDLCSRLCGSLDGKGVWGRTDTCMCVAESLCYPPEAVTLLSADQLWRWWRWFSRSVVSESCAPRDCLLPGSSVCGISLPRDWTCVSCLAGGSFTTGPPGKLYPNTSKKLTKKKCVQMPSSKEACSHSSTQITARTSTLGIPDAPRPLLRILLCFISSNTL